ncbi:MAG: MBOAT family protein [Lachnospiraceae bacterium]|nr:MBOAT family protein [Lachnospiraceae bacterium]
MLFNSYIFIFLFLPLSLLGYFLLNHRHKYTAAKVFLVGMSLWFYAYFHISYLWIILFSIGINYLCHRLLIKKIYPKAILTGGLCLNIGLLFYYKYFDFVLENINALFKAEFSALGILLPLGISFFTFQQVAFLIDTYKGTVPCQNLTDYALFVTFFPQLIAGPIVSHEEMLPQFQDLSGKRFQPDNFYKGLHIFVRGLAKKVLLADTFGQAVNWGFQYYTVLDGPNSLLVILFYAIQIYLDFSGYCDMARGIGYLFNIRITVNFLSPYKSRNILEFWDRWHMTLTRFFTRYVYIPLGGNRKGALRTYVNIMIVYLISGIWHGANWTFILWGVLHGILSVLTRLWHSMKKKLHLELPDRHILKEPAKCLSTLFTFLFVALAWTFFRADTISQAVEMITTAFTFEGEHIFVELAGFFRLPEFWSIIRLLNLDMHPLAPYFCMVPFVLLALFIIFFTKNLYETEDNIKPGILNAFGTAFLGVWCVLSLSGVSTFLYFNF